MEWDWEQDLANATTSTVDWAADRYERGQRTADRMGEQVQPVVDAGGVAWDLGSNVAHAGYDAGEQVVNRTTGWAVEHGSRIANRGARAVEGAREAFGWIAD